MTRRISIIGSTGSIGQKTVDLALKSPTKYKVELLVAFSNVILLAKQALLTKCKNVCIINENFKEELQDLLQDSNITIYAGHAALMDLLQIKVDWAMNSVTSFSGLVIMRQLIKSETPFIAVANKESIVCGGKLLLDMAKKNNIKILPADSEHNSIFRILESKDTAEYITITASGGAFLNYTQKEMENITKEEATKHPIWKMGKKISIDSSTMMNKSLEMIEAHYLFNGIRVETIIHPESIVHGFAHYHDGTTLAILYPPNMTYPIEHTMTWPNPHKTQSNIKLFTLNNKLSFFKPDFNMFPALKLGYDIIKSENIHQNSIMLNASNEIAVDAFLTNQIRFIDIPILVENSLSQCPITKINSIEDIINFDKETRQIAITQLQTIKKQTIIT